jgi:hypothetical protein
VESRDTTALFSVMRGAGDQLQHWYLPHSHSIVRGGTNKIYSPDLISGNIPCPTSTPFHDLGYTWAFLPNMLDGSDDSRSHEPAPLRKLVSWGKP